MTSKCIIASNRLPVAVSFDGDEPIISKSIGGLATGLSSIAESSPTLWVGSLTLPTGTSAKAKKKAIEALKTLDLLPLMPNAKTYQNYYRDFSNGVLWPLYHYLNEHLPTSMRGWDAYVEVNQMFADAIIEHYEAGDTVWVHDYHLSLVPKMLREKIPAAKVGFFLHIPFPSSDIFRILPWRAEVIEGMLGSDLIGFHTHSYQQHFSSAALRVLGLETKLDKIAIGAHQAMVGTFPMGIDNERFNREAGSESILNDLKVLKVGPGETKKYVILSVDRLDYTKGIIRRLLTIEHFLENHAEFRDKATFIQIAAPSREDHETYARYRRKVEEIVGRINGTFGSVSHQPVRYIHQSFSQDELLEFYRGADVMMVTPLRDGMNLVAKEFISTRKANDGVLVLSEFAGASSQLVEATIVNPYDLAQTSEAIATALKMSPADQETRMSALRNRVFNFDHKKWANSFLDVLSSNSLHEAPTASHSAYNRPEDIISDIKDVGKILVLIDYDGTLSPIVSIPDLAAPDREIKQIIQELVSVPSIDAHIVSGRTRDTLDKWLSSYGIGLHAEHGFWQKPPSQKNWKSSPVRIAENWKERIKPILEQFTYETSGSFIEEKTNCLAWHYRMCDQDVAFHKVNELRFQLNDTIANLPLEILMGKKVLEVRQHGINKGLIATNTLSNLTTYATIIAIGDDVTDEDMFRALPARALTIHVGEGETIAKYRVANVKAARSFLHRLAEKAKQDEATTAYQKTQEMVEK